MKISHGVHLLILLTPWGRHLSPLQTRYWAEFAKQHGRKLRRVTRGRYKIQ